MTHPEDIDALVSAIAEKLAKQPTKPSIPLEIATEIERLRGEVRVLRGLLRQAMELRGAPHWPFPGCEATARASAEWWRSVESAVTPNAELRGRPLADGPA